MSIRALHNALFMAVFNNHTQLATKILKHLLGKERAAKLDFRTLKFDATVFNDADGNERRADAIISVMSKGGRRVVFLIEHKSSQNRRIFQQLLAYQTILYTDARDEVVPVVISTAKQAWRLPRHFQPQSNDLCRGTALNFGYLLFDLAVFTADTLKAAFPSEYPFLHAMQSLQQLTHAAVETFFVSSLALPADKRLRLTGQVVNCLTESRGNFSLDRLEEIEAGCIARVKDRLMRTVKIGEEGWLEKGFKKGLAAGKAEGIAEGIAEGEARGKAEGIAEGKAEIALRMLEEGMSIAVICRTTGLNRSALTKLKRKLA